jgi:hypothetical protein
MNIVAVYFEKEDINETERERRHITQRITEEIKVCYQRGQVSSRASPSNK